MWHCCGSVRAGWVGWVGSMMLLRTAMPGAGPGLAVQQLGGAPGGVGVSRDLSQHSAPGQPGHASDLGGVFRPAVTQRLPRGSST